MVISDAVIRLIPGALGIALNQRLMNHLTKKMDCWNIHSTQDPKNLEICEFRTFSYPGNHKKIKEWRSEQSYKKTLARRPDLIKENIK